MKKVVLFFALAVGLLASASTLQSQVNMSRYITLTVKSGEAIRLNFKAAAAGTPVRIVSSSNTQNITVGTNWYNGDDPSTFTVTAAVSTMTVYGDLTSFYCGDNYGNLTAIDLSHNTQLTTLECHNNTLTSLDVSGCTQLTVLNCSSNQLTSLDVSGCTQLTELSCRDNKLTDLDVSKNTQLTTLWCYGNNFSTQALDDIYCALPDRTGKWYGVIYPAYASSSSNHATVLATNAQNAIAKNWKVQYYQNDTDIPTTTGTHVCGTPYPEPNMSRYITLTVKKDSAIKLDLRAAVRGTPVRIVSGSNTQDITVGPVWYNGNSPSTYTVTAGASTMTVYGDIIGFDCSSNGANLTALDVLQNTQLTKLVCSNNRLTSLDVSNNTQLTVLHCHYNTLSSLDVSHNTQLKELLCQNNNLTTLDVSKNTKLTGLSCRNNNLTTLDVSKNTELDGLNCANNKLNSLDVSKNTKLTGLYCSDNKFTTATLDDIFCALPDRTGNTNGKIQPIFNSSSPNHATVLATNKQNAIAKNWKVQYYNDDTDIPTTTGSYVCPQLNMSRYITLTVKSGEAIKLDLKAAAAGTPVRIVSGSNTQDITVGTDWYNGHYPSSFTVTAGSTTITIYGDIRWFSCSENGANLTAIDVSKNTQLRLLGCSSNQLSNLDLSKNTELFLLSCNDNKLTSLDISKESKLKELYCYDNNFTTATLDDIYCALPDRTGKSYGRIQPVHNSSSSNHATVLATNKTNATAKNWKVQYYKNNSDITTTGSYDCSSSAAATAAEPALTLYPNPVADVLYLSATARTIRIYDMYGTEVAHATDTDRVEVSHLPAGVYTVKADGTVAKMVKR